ncbi:hypothetical protein [Frankia sp. BMG5.23]|uniref:hypothetical protein n=1 Tax=Frankia sp. BMG5.23 TaxID=683305 RepID=UPI00128ECEF5|nr:hypothetical protein [Frankia sp. BMG5.23]
MNDTARVTGLGVNANERVQLECYAFGQAVGPYHDSLWYYVVNRSRPTTNYGAPNQGMLNAHYINDGKNANDKDAGVPECVNNFPPRVAPCTNNFRWASTNLTFSYSGSHRYYGNAWQAAKDWTDLGTGITIVPAASGKTGNVVFDDVASPTKTFAAAVMPPGQRDQAIVPPAPIEPTVIHVLVNQTWMEALDDPHKTAALAHELGHTLGLAHSNVSPCAVTAPSIMHSGGTDVPKWTTVTPQYYDKLNLEELYGLPTG